jgi:hypothetical protein
VASNLSRKELLKQDQFSVQVGHSVDFLGAHRKQTILYGGIVIALGLIVWGGFYYRTSQKSTREAALGDAITLTTAAVAPPVPLPNGAPSFATDGAKKDAVTKAFNDIISKYGGSDEAYVSEYYLASMDADGARLDEARKLYQDVSDHAPAGFASLARLSLAQIDIAESRIAEGEALFKDLIAHPTDLVSKDQATIAYARAIGPAKPEEARKLLKPLADGKSDITPIANQVMADIPAK